MTLRGAGKADALCYELRREKVNCAAIHGDKSQDQRDSALEAFKKGRTRVLVATDVPCSRAEHWYSFHIFSGF